MLGSGTSLPDPKHQESPNISKINEHKHPMHLDIASTISAENSLGLLYKKGDLAAILHHHNFCSFVTCVYRNHTVCVQWGVRLGPPRADTETET